MLSGLRCVECGALPRGMKLCHDLFDELLGIKYREDGEAYRLAVACYTFQHPRSHSAKAWWYACYYLDAFVSQGLSSKAAREQGRQHYEQIQGDTPKPSPLLLVDIRPVWQQTIADFSAQVLASPFVAAKSWAFSMMEDYHTWDGTRS